MSALQTRRNIQTMKRSWANCTKKLGERPGLCKLHVEGNPRKVVRSSSVVEVRGWGKGRLAHNVV